MKLTGNIEKDFENYLVKTKLWVPYHESETAWINRIGDKMEQAAERTAVENRSLSEDDYLWWLELTKIQDYYGLERDIIGEFIELKGLTSQRNGQFFTPMSICRLMSEITYSDHSKSETPITVSDCCCGSGRMMIAHAETALNADKSYNKKDFVYYNQDIDYKSFIFTTLNAALRNLTSVNVWGDTLAVKEYKTYITLSTVIGRAPWYDREHELCKQQEEMQKKVG